MKWIYLELKLKKYKMHGNLRLLKVISQDHLFIIMMKNLKNYKKCIKTNLNLINLIDNPIKYPHFNLIHKYYLKHIQIKYFLIKIQHHKEILKIMILCQNNNLNMIQ